MWEVSVGLQERQGHLASWRIVEFVVIAHNELVTVFFLNSFALPVGAVPCPDTASRGFREWWRCQASWLMKRKMLRSLAFFAWEERRWTVLAWYIFYLWGETVEWLRGVVWPVARCLPKIFIEMIIPSVTDDDRVHFYWKIIEDSEQVLPTAVGGIDIL